MSAPVLQVHNLKKAYGAIQAVGGVSFEVRPGEIFGVIGPNGSGKTTLFNSMLGQITPDEGRIELKGEDVTQLGPLELNRRGGRARAPRQHVQSHVCTLRFQLGWQS